VAEPDWIATARRWPRIVPLPAARRCGSAVLQQNVVAITLTLGVWIVLPLLVTLSLAKPGAVMMYPGPTFVMYAMNATYFGMRAVAAGLRPDFSLDAQAFIEAMRANSAKTDSRSRWSRGFLAFALLFDARGFSAEIPEVVELCATDPAMTFHRAPPDVNGFGSITSTPSFTRSSQVLIPFGFPLRTAKTTTDVDTKPSYLDFAQLSSTRPLSRALAM